MTAVRVAGDGSEVSLDMPLRAGWMYQLRFTLTGANGGSLANGTAWYTLNRLRR